jgi:O-antigen/teichoic acid export membrane protein
VRPPESLVLAFSIWLVLLALNQPQAMLLNALHDEKFQMIAASANLVANVALSVVFTRKFGVSGPIWGTVVAQLVCALIPSTMRIRVLLVRSEP